MRRCAKCGARDTGWRPTRRGGAVWCPACAQGIGRDDAAAELARRRALLERLGKEAPYPGQERLKSEVRCEIERIEKRIADERKHQSAGGCGF